ncbi:MAG: glycosyltransferase family 4 protein [Oscillospiraceae bacterium]|nr:glycosyltransferase family 4 protein [Oscillospiraceae bacterium]
MKVLLVNKFLYPKGGAETYTFKLGELLENCGHSVQYFGLANPKNIVGNTAGEYVADLDFGKGIAKNLTKPLRIINSSESRRKISKVLYDFNPDIVHLNNIHFHLTPSIIAATQQYRAKTGKKVKIVYTAHDYQLICPSHGLFDSDIKICEKCLGGKYINCFKTKCVKRSAAKSLLATADAYYWKHSKTYSYIDTIICPSAFLKKKLDTQPRFASKTVALHNFIEPIEPPKVAKSDYVIEFGHLCRDKGTNTLLEVAKRMPQTRFLFAGYGAAVEDMKDIKNAEYVGFKTGQELQTLIAQALCSVYPSEWYENCPFSVIESQLCSTPVVASNMGGIPEIMQNGKTGLLFEAGNADDLEQKLKFLLNNSGALAKFADNCKKMTFETPETYYKKLMGIYE